MRKKFFHAHARTCTRIYVDLYKTRLQGQNGYDPSVPYISTILADGLLRDVTKSVFAGGKKTVPRFFTLSQAQMDAAGRTEENP